HTSFSRDWSSDVCSSDLADGVDLALDQYPYPASSTTMVALVHAWAAEGGTAALAARLNDPDVRAAVRDEVLNGPTDGRPKRDFRSEERRVGERGAARGPS